MPPSTPKVNAVKLWTSASFSVMKLSVEPMLKISRITAFLGVLQDCFSEGFLGVSDGFFRSCFLLKVFGVVAVLHNFVGGFKVEGGNYGFNFFLGQVEVAAGNR